ncbi:WecB/TagA/CpsF family glycosyltransferase [Psychromonas sp.]|uniref:WecB/TagA/CpsF family glycosyltransferase n=1 Tax=Psychromonas sp. TaxID=1884585 RepID=UPI003562C538
MTNLSFNTKVKQRGFTAKLSARLNSSNDRATDKQTNPYDEKICRLFDLPINNVSMDKAIHWVVTQRFSRRAETGPAEQANKTRLAFFINAHSINLSFKQPEFYQTLKKADCLFADGCGMRLASRHIGDPLLDNVNGTDMLPELCRQAAKEQKSIYFLGSAPGVAKQAAQSLKKSYPGLIIAGHQHGFFNPQENGNIIAAINHSEADILLVGLGSPVQEAWLAENADLLRCKTALAVGGLLDFYSGNMPRAPLWLRNLGLEWLYRLMQEPQKKFNRYVLGNPLFLIRTYLLNRVTRPISDEKVLPQLTQQTDLS